MPQESRACREDGRVEQKEGVAGENVQQKVGPLVPEQAGPDTGSRALSPPGGGSSGEQQREWEAFTVGVEKFFFC